MFDWFKRLSLKQATRSLYIARPPEFADRLIYLHDNRSIARGAKVTVRADECVLFFREGRLVGRLDPGTYLLDTANIPFLGQLVVDDLTAANHFISEIFFVTTREVAQIFNDIEVGQFRDNNSRNVVKVLASLGYTVRVKDPAKLIIGLGGQNADADVTVENILKGRASTALRQSVAARVQRTDILDVVSNIEVDAIGQELVDAAQQEFSPLGIEIIRAFDLNLDLDQESRARLVEFGQMEAKLAYQAKGASIARKDGFAEFNAIQGQLAAMEGLGKGLGSGNSPMLLSGSIGGFASRNYAPSYSQNRAPSTRGPAPISNQSSYILIDGMVEKGPFTARQIALTMIAEGLHPQNTSVRRVDDPDSLSFTADMEPLIMTEYSKRKKPRPPESTPSSNLEPATEQQSIHVLDAALRAAGADGSLMPPARDLLIQMAQSLGLVRDRQAGLDLVSDLAIKAGITMPSGTSQE